MGATVIICELSLTFEKGPLESLCNNKQGVALSARIDFALRNEISEVARVLDALEIFSGENDIPSKKAFQLQLVMDELITNIVSYGFDEQVHSDIRLSVRVENGAIIGELADNGIRFDPTERKIPEFSSSLDERQIGGIGLKFVHVYTDELAYEYDGTFNRLRLKMNLADHA